MSAILKSGRLAVLLCALAAALGAAVYLNALKNPFVYDDYRTVLENESLDTLNAPRAIVLHDVTRPLVNLSYAADRALWGMAPFGFHLTNVLLHVVNVVLVFLIAVRLLHQSRLESRIPNPNSHSLEFPAFATAALFAVHPLMTGAVGYVSGRTDVLCTTFFLSGFLTARRWLRTGGRRWWILSLGFWMASLLSKETAAVLPLVLFAYQRLLPEHREPEKRPDSWKLYAPLVGLAALAGVVRLGVFVFVERVGRVEIAWSALLEQAIVVWRFAGLLLFPKGQTIYHAVRPVQSVFDARALLAVAALLVTIGWAWHRPRRQHHEHSEHPGPLANLLKFGVLWFVLALAPSAILELVDQGGGMAEHRVYLASVGPFLGAGVFVLWFGAALGRISARLQIVGGAALAVVLLTLGAHAMLRNAVWADPVALWREAAENAPDYWLPQTVLGESLHAALRHEEAVTAFRRALILNPDHEMGYMDLGICLTELGRSDEAAATFEALRRKAPQSLIVSTGLGAVAFMKGDVQTARRHFQETLDKDPNDVMTLQWMAILEEEAVGNPAEALRRCEQIEHIVPGRRSVVDCIRRNRARLADAGARPAP